MNQDSSRKKLILIGSIAAAIILIVLLIVLFGKKDTFEYKVLVDPPDSVLTIDGVPTQPGRIRLSEGEHTLKATREFFEDAVVVVNTKDLSPKQEILVIPQAKSPEALKWLEDHPDTTGISEKIGAATVAERNRIVDERYPITDKLPFNSIDYKVDYAVDDEFNISFTITLYPYAKPDNPDDLHRQLKEFKAEALQFLSDNGIDPNAVSITYIPAEAGNL